MPSRGKFEEAAHGPPRRLVSRAIESRKRVNRRLIGRDVAADRIRVRGVSDGMRKKASKMSPSVDEVCGGMRHALRMAALGAA